LPAPAVASPPSPPPSNTPPVPAVSDPPALLPESPPAPASAFEPPWAVTPPLLFPPRPEPPMGLPPDVAFPPVAGGAPPLPLPAPATGSLSPSSSPHAENVARATAAANVLPTILCFTVRFSRISHWLVGVIEQVPLSRSDQKPSRQTWSRHGEYRQKGTTTSQAVPRFGCPVGHPGVGAVSQAQPQFEP
jgi:hypothetical protein